METSSYTPNQFLPGIYTTATMPSASANPYMLAWNSDANYNCWMESDGTKWNQSRYKRTEVLSGTTDATGNIVFTFANTYTTIPNIQPVITNQADQNTNFRITATSLTGCAIKVEAQASVPVALISLTIRLGTSTNVAGSNVSILVTET